ncbi:LuxR C-terminal-related transcriptional regulator [Streptomyces sp. NPDC057271]|uniref:helix-turn-helix transcriptional regulator n=1 Tax=unclassified Streptomyces TaxID=2593676 RepID=UPI0036363E1F
MAVPVDETSAVERARDAAARDAWAEAYVLLREADRHPSAALDAADLDLLADASWWTGHVDESVTARLRAHAGYVAAGDHRGAGQVAWWLHFEYRCLGRPAAAAGWLHRSRHHLEDEPDCPEQCLIAWTDSEEAQEHRDPEGALAAARTEVALAVGDLDDAAEAVAELEGLPGEAPLLRAVADTARGALDLARHEPAAVRPLRRALACWLELRVPYEAAQVRMLLAAADRAAGDEEAARLELMAARAAFERLGALPDARRAAALLTAGRRRALPGGLTAREAEVLRLVAEGGTNRDIAQALVISEHTVARHLNNIFAKLDVTSRTAATAYAYAHGMAGTPG